METILIGISIGDINGIGPEVVLRTFSNKKLLSWCTPIIYASTQVIDYHLSYLENVSIDYKSINTLNDLSPGKLNILSCWDETVEIKLGEVNNTGGKYAQKSLTAATEDLLSEKTHALVTAPIHKKAMQLSGFKYPGHTEYLTETLKAHESLMFMVNDDLRVGLVTNHLPVEQIAEKVTKKEILRKLKVMNTSLIKDFGIDKPKIAVLGLNPHAGDDGAIGKEDKETIVPAIQEAKKQGIIAVGPFPADGFFGAGTYKKYDAIIAMYHDQGLVPFKTLSFGNGVNYTAGLKGVRTSPDHGTGHDIAGQGIADATSFRHAIFQAIDIVKHRNRHEEITKNPVKKNRKTYER